MKHIKKRIRREWQMHLMLLPGILLILIFSEIHLYVLVIAI